MQALTSAVLAAAHLWSLPLVSGFSTEAAEPGRHSHLASPKLWRAFLSGLPSAMGR